MNDNPTKADGIKSTSASSHIDKYLDEILKEEEIIPPPKITITVAPDRMLAFLKIDIFEKDQTVDPQDVYNMLMQMSIEQGVDKSTIKAYCQRRMFYKEIKIAYGRKPIKGEDGYYKLTFDPDKQKVPVELEDGRVDFKNFDAIENVIEGAILCEVTMATAGIEGVDVYGNPIPPQHGKNPTWPVGKNCQLKDDKYIVATINGAVKFINKRIVVEETFIVDGDVGPVTGSIVFKGNVIVKGDVLEGFSIKADKTISVRGSVEGAQLIAGENVSVSLGINGMHKGTIEAGGDIITRYVENATVVCRGTFRAGTAINSVIKAKDSIIIKGSKGALLNGELTAGRIIYAMEIGTEVSNVVELTLREGWYEQEYEKNDFIKKELTIEQSQAKVKKLETDLGCILEEITKIRSLNQEGLDEKIKLQNSQNLRKFILAKTKLTTDIKSEIEYIERKTKEKEENKLKLICTKTMYPGAKINIGDATVTTEQSFYNTKFVLNGLVMTTDNITPQERNIR